jgi:hypothetical protein
MEAIDPSEKFITACKTAWRQKTTVQILIDTQTEKQCAIIINGHEIHFTRPSVCDLNVGLREVSHSRLQKSV